MKSSQIKENNDIKVNVIIPFLSDLSSLKRCVKSIQGSKYVNHIYIINSGVENVKQHYVNSNVIEVFADDNYWWTAAVNSGVQLSMLSNSKYSTLINSDNFFEDGSLNKLVEIAESHKLNIVGSMVKYDNGNAKHCGVKVNLNLGKQEFINYTSSFSRNINEVDSLGGQGVLINNDTFRKVGLFNVLRLPHYSADLDFYLRAKECGYKVFCLKESVVIDDINSTGLIKAAGRYSIFDLIKIPFSIRSHLHYKNQWYLCQRHWDKKYISFANVYYKFVLSILKNIIIRK